MADLRYPALYQINTRVWLTALSQKVKDSLAANQDDQLIIEGYPLMQGSQPVLLAQSCVSMLQQRAQKQAQQQPEPAP